MLDLLPDDRQASDLEASSGPTEGLSDFDLLHGISVALIGEQDRNALYGKIVDAAVAITGSQFGTMQRVCPKGDRPRRGTAPAVSPQPSGRRRGLLAMGEPGRP